MKRFASMILSLAMTLPSGAALAGGTPDRERALKDSPQVLARDALGALGPAFVEVERPTFSGMFGAQPIQSLSFATRPWSAGYPGLCEASVAWVAIGWSPDDDSPGAPLNVRQVYKAVGDLEWRQGGWSTADDARLKARCRSAGRVLRSESGDMNQAGYFSSEGGAYPAWQAVRVLQHAIDAAGGPVVPACAPVSDQRRERCSDPATALAGLKLERLTSVSLKSCPDALELTCVEGEFLKDGGSNSQSFWTLRVRAVLKVGQDWGAPYPLTPDHALNVLELRTITLDLRTVSYD